MGGIEGKQLWPTLSLEGLRKFTKISVRMFGVPADFLT